jgi:mannose-6-phosphate isomerase-like protein (cupin superfamily)
VDDVVFGVVERPVYTRRDARGVFDELVTTGRWESVIAGTMTKGAVMGHHYHHHTVVAVFLLEGRARIVTEDVGTKARRECEIHAGQGFVFRPSEARAIHYLEDARFLLLKSHRYDPAAPDLIDYRVG